MKKRGRRGNKNTMYDFKIISQDTGRTVYNTANIPDIPGYRRSNKAREQGIALMKEKGWNDDDYFVAVVNKIPEVEPQPTERQIDFMKKIIEKFMEISVIRMVDGSLKRFHYNHMQMHILYMNDLMFLKKTFPEFDFTNIHRSYYQIQFKKEKDWEFKRLPEI